MNSFGQKHLVTCKCVLPQFKHMQEPPPHQFIVFSVIENDVVKPKFAQCPNCGRVHRVIELNKSEIVPKESMPSIMTIEDIKHSIHDGLRAVLEANQADVATWEAVQYIIDNKRWGEFVVLVSESEGGSKQGKYVRILGEKMFKVEPFERKETI